MAAITNTQLRARLASIMRVSTSDTTIDASSPWEQLITDAASSGYEDVVSRLMARGFTKAQVDLWRRLTEFNVDISLYWLFTKGAGLHAYDDKFINKFDRRLELDTVYVVDSSDNPITPTYSRRINTGVISTATDNVVLDTEDERIGEATDW